MTQDGSVLIADDAGTLVVSQATIDALTTAASLAAAVGSTVGVSVTGAGAVATNVVVTKVNAFVEDGDVDSAGDMTLAASSDAAIVATVASLSVAIGGGTVGVGVALGASAGAELHRLPRRRLERCGRGARLPGRRERRRRLAT